MRIPKTFQTLSFFCTTLTFVSVAETPAGPHKKVADQITVAPRATMTDFFSQPLGAEPGKNMRGSTPEIKSQMRAKNIDTTKGLVSNVATTFASLDAPPIDAEKTDAQLCDSFNKFYDLVLAEGRSADGKPQASVSLLQTLAPRVPLNDLPPELSNFFSGTRKQYFIARGACPIRKNPQETENALATRRKTVKDAVDSFRNQIKLLNTELEEVK